MAKSRDLTKLGGYTGTSTTVNVKSKCKTCLSKEMEKVTDEYDNGKIVTIMCKSCGTLKSEKITLK